MITTWPAPSREEYALAFDQARPPRLLVIPALFDEGNKLRHFTVQTMRVLDALEVDCFLPDLPGSNESSAPHEAMSLESWREAMTAAAKHFNASHVLAIRGGSLCAPGGLPLIHYAPVEGASLLRAMLRAEVISAREAGRETTREELMDAGRADGLTLGGRPFSPAMLAQLETAKPAEAAHVIAQSELGGPGLWLRAEPEHDQQQAEALAARVQEHLG